MNESESGQNTGGDSRADPGPKLPPGACTPQRSSGFSQSAVATWRRGQRGARGPSNAASSSASSRDGAPAPAPTETSWSRCSFCSSPRCTRTECHRDWSRQPGPGPRRSMLASGFTTQPTNTAMRAMLVTRPSIAPNKRGAQQQAAGERRVVGGSGGAEGWLRSGIVMIRSAYAPCAISFPRSAALASPASHAAPVAALKKTGRMVSISKPLW